MSTSGTPSISLTATGGVLTPPGVAPARPGRRKRGGVTRLIVLLVCAIYFFGPLITAFIFTIKDTGGGITFSAYTEIFAKQPGSQVPISTALRISFTLAVLTIVLTLALMIPTQLLLHLKYRKVRPVVEIITLLPLVFPPVVLVVGISDTFTYTQANLQGPIQSTLTFLRDVNRPYILALIYVTLSMPFVYRAIDAGLRSIDTPTLVEAARNLGAGWPTVVLRVLIPCLRTSIVNAAFLCFALVMGEFTIANILLYGKTFPVWLVQLPSASGQVQAATSLLSLLIVEIMLLLIGALNWRRGAERKS